MAVHCVSFGYLLLPIVMVAAGRVFFKERISTFKFIAVIIATLGVISNIVLKGGLSWEAIVICLGYTAYFFYPKSIKNTDLASFCLEMLSLMPVSIYFAFTNRFRDSTTNQSVYLGASCITRINQRYCVNCLCNSQ